MRTFIYQHLEVGDHIICNGLIRELCKNNPQDQHFLAAKKLNIESVLFSFRDVKNLEVVCINGTQDLSKEINRTRSEKFIKIGHGLIDINLHFDEGFYKQKGVPFEKRWSSFFVQRDEVRESSFFNKFNIDSEYAFVHEDASRGMVITKGLNPELRVIKTERSLTDNIFDYLKLIENAKEIHCIPSSFLFLVDSFNFKGDKFLHKYSRQYPHHGAPSLRLAWNEIN